MDTANPSSVWRKVFFIWLAWLIAVNAFALIANNRVNLAGDTAYTWIDPSSFHQESSWDIAALHAHWDSAFYTDIAEHGYRFLGPDKLSNIVFFPAYPFLIALVAMVLFAGLHLALAGWIVSAAALYFALALLYKLVERFHSGIAPELVLAMLLVFPTAFFLNAVYTEALFLFLSIAAFYAALEKKFLLAGAIGFAAALTRVTGVLLFLPLLIEYLAAVRKGGTWKQGSWWRGIWPVFLVPLGTFLFLLYHRIAFGDFFLFFKVEKWWGRAFAINWSHFLLFSRPAIVNFALDSGFIVLAIAAVVFMFRRFRPSYGVYAATTLGVALSTGTFMSIGRYLLVLFPIFVWLAGIKNPYVRYGWMLFSTMLFALYTLLFVNNYWAG